MALDSLNKRISNLTAGVTDPKMLEALRRVQSIFRELSPSASDRSSRTWVSSQFPSDAQKHDLLIDKVWNVAWVRDAAKPDDLPQTQENKLIGVELMRVMLPNPASPGQFLCRRSTGTGNMYGPLESVWAVEGQAWNNGQLLAVFSVPALSTATGQLMVRVSLTPVY